MNQVGSCTTSDLSTGYSLSYSGAHQQLGMHAINVQKHTATQSGDHCQQCSCKAYILGSFVQRHTKWHQLTQRRSCKLIGLMRFSNSFIIRNVKAAPHTLAATLNTRK